MDPHEYRLMFEQEERHWWFQSRALIIEKLLQRHVAPYLKTQRTLALDLGCGTGMFMMRHGGAFETFGADFSIDALHYCNRRGLGRIVRADACRPPFRDGAFDLVTAFDLIEHVEADRQLVSEACRMLAPGGFMIASVPAHPALWSGHDISLHHYRRYTRAGFEALFDPAQWETIRMTPGFCGILPLAAAIRVGRRVLGLKGVSADSRPVWGWLNSLLIRLHVIEANAIEKHDLPAGVSFFAILRKRG